MTEEQVFLAVLDLPDAAARIAYLDAACGKGTAFRRQVEALLAAHFRSGEFLDVPAPQQVELDASSANTLTIHGDAEPAREAIEDGDDLDFLTPSTRPDSLGRLGHYEVLEVLGKGGFGIVFRAFDDDLQRVVAVKVLAPHLAATSPARKRFLREARSSARVRHENVVQIYAVEEHPLPYLVMEFVPGETLQERLDRTGPLDTMEVVRIGRQLAEGLAAAHGTGLIHRDIKPANILIEASPHQHVKITDFGLARAADDASLTQSGVVAGTPMYMAPEQAQGDSLDHRADLFSLGSVLYAICSGRPPFRASSTLAVLKRVAEDTPRPITEIIPEVPQWLCDIISRLHAKKPEDRFGTAREVADLLERGLAALQRPGQVPSFPELRPLTPKPKPQEEQDTVLVAKPRSRRRGLAIAAVVLLALVGGLGFAEGTGVTDMRGTVVRLFSPEGTLVVEIDDPDVSIRIDGSDIVITGAGVREIRLKTGDYTVETRKDGKVVRRELVNVTKNGRPVVRVTYEPPPEVKPTKPTSEVTEWERSVAAMPAEQQVEAVRKELKKRNPKFDGKVEETLADGRVQTLKVDGGGLSDVSPIRALSALENVAFNCPDLADLSPLRGMNLTNLEVYNSSVSDLSPLKGMKLRLLELSGSRNIADLSPLRGMPLQSLTIYGTQVSNLTPLKESQLEYLNCSSSEVSDLSPLQGLPLTALNVNNCKVTNLAPIKNLPLKLLNCDFLEPRDGNIVRAIKTLETINGKPVAQFWKDVEEQAKNPDHRAAAYVLSVGGIVKINGQEQEIKAAGELPQEAFQLTWATLFQKQPSDAGLAALKGCTNLTYLNLDNTPVGDAGLAHLAGCKNLTYLNIGHTQATDAGLASLKDLEKLAHLNLDGSQIGDAGLAHLKGLKNLTVVWAQGTGVTDAGLAHLKNCKNLAELNLNGSPVGDAGLAHLKDFKNLSSLSLNNTLNNMTVTDAGLDHLKNCKSLTTLLLVGNKVTATGIDGLKTALPKCRIEWDGGVIEPK